MIKLETEYEPIEEGSGPKAWAEGRWGRPFVTSESEFDCYGPYCANYLDAITVVNEQMPNLLRGQDLPESQRPCLHPERELQAFMIKPIQRITKYGLLLDAILHATAKHDYPYRSELEEGSAAVRRIAAGINEVTDFKAKQATVRELLERVDDWKGHELEKFGDLWLDDHFTVTKGDQPREYHVFLFEKMMLCCKEIIPERSKKNSKNSSMLRKDKTASKSGMPEKRKLALKGRIFVSNIRQASVIDSGEHPASGWNTQLMPDVTPKMIIRWTVPQRQANGHHEEVEDYFIISGKSEDMMKKWADKVMELANLARKKQEEERAERARRSDRYLSGDRNHYLQSSFAPPTPAAEQPPFVWPPSGPSEQDIDDGYRSGRTTPSMGSSATYISQSYGASAGRRVQSQQAMPADRQAELRARAMTEDQFGPSMTQWRSQQPPPLPRLTSAMSALSTTSDASFGMGPPRSGRQLSQSRLGRAEEIEEESPTEATSGYNHPRYAPARGMARAPSHGVGPTVPYPPPLRSRSASSPNVYQVPKVSPAVLPTIPSSSWAESPSLATSSSSTLVGGTAYFTKRQSGSNKRSSSESQNTETSETSSQSPATPYDIGSRQNSQDVNLFKGPTMVVKIRCGDDSLTITVPHDIDYAGFHSKVVKKIRTCRGAASLGMDGLGAGVQIKWVDADDDEVTLRCDADLEAMWEECKEMGTKVVNIVAR